MPDITIPFISRSDSEREGHVDFRKPWNAGGTVRQILAQYVDKQGEGDGSVDETVLRAKEILSLIDAGNSVTAVEHLGNRLTLRY